MKTKYIAKRRKVGGFTLLELLVVVGILAIIAGAIITAYDGFAENAARKTAANTVASMTSTIRTAQTTQGSLPTNVESLITSSQTTFTAATATEADNTADSAVNDGRLNSFIHPNLVEKIGTGVITGTQLRNLVNAGITSVRYIPDAGDPSTLQDLSTRTDDNLATGLTNIDSLDILTGTDSNTLSLNQATTMQSIYGPPTSRSRNMGRGFRVDLPGQTEADAAFDTAAAANTVALWGGNGGAPFAATVDPSADPLVANYLNVEVGADPAAVLVAFGIGQESSLIGGPSANGDTVKLAAAPFYGAVQPNQYNHYIMLVDVTKDPALFVTVVDSRGNNLDQGLNGL